MSSLAVDILVGVVSGIILSCLGFLFAMVILPWIQSITYSGVKLDGNWLNEFSVGNSEYRFESTVAQSARNLKGSTVITKRSPGDKYRTEMYLKGRIVEGFVTISLESQDPKCLSVVSGVLKIESRGASLKGWLAYRTSINDEVAIEEALWERVQ